MPADVLERRRLTGREGEDPSRSSHIADEPGCVLCGQARLIALAAGVDKPGAGGDTFKIRVTLFVVLPDVAVMVSALRTVLLVVNTKDPLIRPAAIVTAAGTCRPVFVDFKVTVVAAAMGLWRRAVQLPDAPAWMARGVHVKEDRTGVAVWRTRETLAWLDP